MGTERTDSHGEITVQLSLRDVFCDLNARRIDIDRQMADLAPEDPMRDLLWQEQETVMRGLRDVVSQLAASPATDLHQIRDKADVLAGLLGSGENPGCPMLPDAEKLALALSLTVDIGRLPLG